MMLTYLGVAACCWTAVVGHGHQFDGKRVGVTAGPALTGPTRSENVRLADFLHYHETTYINVPANTPRDGVSITFSAHGQDFAIDLAPNRALFTADFTAEYHTKDGVQAIELDRDRFHVGTVQGVPDSLVHTTFRHDGMIECVIRFGAERYHVEPASRYPDAAVDMQPGHNHVVFRASHIQDAALEAAGLSCGNGQSDGEAAARAKAKRGTAAADSGPRLSADFLADVAQQGQGGRVIRQRRAEAEAGASGYSDCRSVSGNCVCTAGLFADSLFVASTYGEGSPTVAAQYMVNQLAQADSNFRRTDFGGLTGYGMAASKIRIYGSGEGPQSSDGTSLSLLESFANNNQNLEQCVGHMFTSQNFQGTLGLAYIGTICNQYNYGFHSAYGIGTVVQQLTLTHELGHSWGAEHDPEGTSCAPDNSNGGRYLMYAAATDGSMRNNKMFSTCSRSSINSALQKAGCLSQEMAYCGNGIVEPGELCDCGVGCTASSCCTSDCQINTNYGYTCVPQDPIQFPCCTPEDGSTGQCQFTASAAQKLCDKADECVLDNYCDGSSAACPALAPKPDGTECDCYAEDCAAHPGSGAKVCSSGACNTWACTLFGAERCIGDGRSCALSCRGGSFGDGAACVSTFDKDQRPAVINVSGIYVGEGTTCDDYQGYCSKRGYCYTVGADFVSRWKDRSQEFFSEYGWMLFAGIAVTALLQYGFRRLYRVKRRQGYEALPNAPVDRHREYVVGRGFPPVEPNDGFEEWQSDDESTEDETNISGEQETDMDNLAAEYDRQALQVAFDGFKQRIGRGMDEQAVAAIEQDLRFYMGDAAKPDLSVGQVEQLQAAFNDRKSVLRGEPVEPPSAASVAADVMCNVIDTSRLVTATAISKTSKTVTHVMQKVKEEDKKAEEFLYF